MPAKRGLGRGLDALIKDGTAPEPAEGGEAGVQRVAVGRIRRSALQPRRIFGEQALAELTDSVRELGVLQPLLVRASGDGYELIAGERRLRAAVAAGLADVPVIVMSAGDAEALEMALVENLQRDDLNALEEAEGYQVLAERFAMTQEQVALRVGKPRATVANSLRLLGLPGEVKQMLAESVLSAGHAKALLGLEIEQEQVLLARRAAAEGLSVRTLEKIVERARRKPRRPRTSRDDIPTAHAGDLSDRLHRHFGSRVRVVSCRTLANGKKIPGYLAIEFFTPDDLDRILDLLGLADAAT
jgi:ParB family chromosome partitioning protein